MGPAAWSLAVRWTLRRRRGLLPLVVALSVSVGGATAIWATFLSVSSELARAGELGLVRVWDPSRSGSERVVGAAQLAALADELPSILDVGSYAQATHTIQSIGGPTWRVNGLEVSSTFFLLAQARFSGATASARFVRPLIEAVPTVVSRRLSERLGVSLGDQVSVDEAQGVIVGILSEPPWLPSTAVDVWVPERAEDSASAGPSGSSIRLVHGFATLRNGVTLADLRRGTRGSALETLRSLEFELFEDQWRRTLLPPFHALRAAAVFLLLIGSLNAAALFFRRSADATASLAQMFSLGASARHLARLQSIDAVLIGLLSWPLALLCAIVVLWLSRQWTIYPGVGLEAPTLSVQVAAASFVGTIAASVLASAPAAWRVGRQIAGSQVLSRRPRSWVLLSQVALVTSLGALAFVQASSVRHVMSQSFLGFTTENLLGAHLAKKPTATTSDEAPRRFADLVETLRVDHGAAAAVSALPLSGYDRSMSLRLRGAERNAIQVGLRLITPSYFSVTGMRFVSGTGFRSDTQDSARQVVVNERLATTVLGRSEVVGSRIILGGEGGPDYEIVGVINSVRHGSLLDEPRPEAFISFEQSAQLSPVIRERFWEHLFIVVPSTRPNVSMQQIQQHVAAVLPNYEIASIRPFRDFVFGVAGDRAAVAGISALFGATTMVMLMLGLYGTAAHALLARGRDMAIRVALGSTSRRAIWAVLRPMVLTGVAGLGAGVGLAVVTGLVMRSWWPVPPQFDEGAEAVAAVVMSASAVSIGLLAAALAAVRSAIRSPLMAELTRR